MEKKNQLKDDTFLQHPILILLVIVLGLVIMDPFQMGPVGGIEFRPVKHNIAPYKQVMENWPRDNQSRLGLGKLEFEGEVFGPESLEFDHLGRGPYTGLADGRIVRWMGKDVGWETFALVTTNWCVVFYFSLSILFLLIWFWFSINGNKDFYSFLCSLYEFTNIQTKIFG